MRACILPRRRRAAGWACLALAAWIAAAVPAAWAGGPPRPAGAAARPAQAGPPATADRRAGELRVLLANVGNANVHCQPYAFKLCFTEVERRVGLGIRDLQPDLVALIEVWPTERCASVYGGLPEPDPQKVCWPLAAHPYPHQVQRLVGPGYRIACDARFAWDCLAVREGRLELAQCPGTGCLALKGLETAPPVPGCDPGFTVNAADVTRSPLGRFRIVFAHPDAGFFDPERGRACRRAQLEQAFALAGDGPTLLLGDFNLDPWRDRGYDVDLWNAHVGPGRRFRYHSGIAEHDPPYPTQYMGETSNLLPTGMMLPTAEEPVGAFPRRTIDHVASDFLRGTCITLGEAPGTRRLDGGPGGGMDHRAVLCPLRAGPRGR